MPVARLDRVQRGGIVKIRGVKARSGNRLRGEQEGVFGFAVTAAAASTGWTVAASASGSEIDTNGTGTTIVGSGFTRVIGLSGGGDGGI